MVFVAEMFPANLDEKRLVSEDEFAARGRFPQSIGAIRSTRVAPTFLPHSLQSLQPIVKPILSAAFPVHLASMPCSPSSSAGTHGTFPCKSGSEGEERPAGHR